MRLSLLPITCLMLACTCGCASDELPGPAVNLFREVPVGTRPFKRGRGEAEMYLTRHDPSYTFWNDEETKQDPWGTVTLKAVEPDGTVVVDFSDLELRAKPGHVFPGTGFKVIASNPFLGTALLRTRWTLSFIERDP